MRRFLPVAVMVAPVLAVGAVLVARAPTSQSRLAVTALLAVTVAISLWRPSAGLVVILTAVAALSLLTGRLAGFLGALLVMPGLLLALSRHGWRRWSALAVAALGLMLLLGAVVPVAAGFVALFLLDLMAWRRYWRRLVQPVTAHHQPEVAPGAEERVAAFRTLGFETVGALRFTIRGRPRVGTVMRSSDGTSGAVVTDLTSDVTSCFGGRLLETSSSALAPIAPHFLRQAVPAGSPADLVDLHRRALRLLEERGMQPDPLEAPEWVELLRRENERALADAAGHAWSSAVGVSLGMVGRTHALRGDPEVDERIRLWWEVTPPAPLGEGSGGASPI